MRNSRSGAFASLDDALASGKPFVVRSEHPQDYNGASGIVDSLYIKPEEIYSFRGRYGTTVDWELLKRKGDVGTKLDVIMQMIGQLGAVPQDEFESNVTRLSDFKIRSLSRFAGLDFDEFQGQISYSYWEGLTGVNRAVIADSAIAGKYHIYTTIHAPRGGVMYLAADAYRIVENGATTIGGGHKVPEEPDSTFQSLISFYEHVRQLERFDSNHCPIIEVQSVGDDLYFLQYHRTVNFSGSTFVLDREPEQDEVSAVLVRGATPPEGLQVTVGVNYSARTIPTVEEGGVDYPLNPAFSEAFVRRRKLQIQPIGNHPSYLFQGNAHLPRSRLFKPSVSVVLYKNLWESITEGISYGRENPNPQVRIGIVSDGRKAYLKRVE